MTGEILDVVDELDWLARDQLPENAHEGLYADQAWDLTFHC